MVFFSMPVMQKGSMQQRCSKDPLERMGDCSFGVGWSAAKVHSVRRIIR